MRRLIHSLISFWMQTWRLLHRRLAAISFGAFLRTQTATYNGYAFLNHLSAEILVLFPETCDILLQFVFFDR
jgi:hypothetical protein